MEGKEEGDWKSSYQVQTRSTFQGIISWSRQLVLRKSKNVNEELQHYPLLIKIKPSRREDLTDDVKFKVEGDDGNGHVSHDENHCAGRKKSGKVTAAAGEKRLPLKELNQEKTSRECEVQLQKTNNYSNFRRTLLNQRVNLTQVSSGIKKIQNIQIRAPAESFNARGTMVELENFMILLKPLRLKYFERELEKLNRSNGIKVSGVENLLDRSRSRTRSETKIVSSSKSSSIETSQDCDVNKLSPSNLVRLINNLHNLKKEFPGHASPVEGYSASSLSSDRAAAVLQNDKKESRFDTSFRKHNRNSKGCRKSYSALIDNALKQNPEGLTTSQIYSWIISHCSYIHPDDGRWKTGVRSTLSLSPYFQKSGKFGGSTGGKGRKGCLWIRALVNGKEFEHRESFDALSPFGKRLLLKNASRSDPIALGNTKNRLKKITERMTKSILQQYSKEIEHKQIGTIESELGQMMHTEYETFFPSTEVLTHHIFETEIPACQNNEELSLKTKTTYSEYLKNEWTVGDNLVDNIQNWSHFPEQMQTFNYTDDEFFNDGQIYEHYQLKEPSLCEFDELPGNQNIITFESDWSNSATGIQNSVSNLHEENIAMDYDDNGRLLENTNTTPTKSPFGKLELEVRFWG